MAGLTIDIIILSYASNNALQKVTEDCVQSLKETETDSCRFNIIVFESANSLSPFEYSGTKTLYPKYKFNFHKYLNLGTSITTNRYICYCNNDLIFHPGWAQELIGSMHYGNGIMSSSPICPDFHPTIGINPYSKNLFGYEIRKEIAGWCFLVDRRIFDIIGKFDEKFSFWFADADYSKTLEKHKIKHVLVTSAIVRHLDGRSTAELDSGKKKAMTTGQFWYFQYKWEHRNYLIYLYRRFRNRIRQYLNND